jgi:hypothetical protein
VVPEPPVETVQLDVDYLFKRVEARAKAMIALEEQERPTRTKVGRLAPRLRALVTCHAQLLYSAVCCAAWDRLDSPAWLQHACGGPGHARRVWHAACASHHAYSSSSSVDVPLGGQVRGSVAEVG